MNTTAIEHTIALSNDNLTQEEVVAELEKLEQSFESDPPRQSAVSQTVEAFIEHGYTAIGVVKDLLFTLSLLR